MVIYYNLRFRNLRWCKDLNAKCHNTLLLVKYFFLPLWTIQMLNDGNHLKFLSICQLANMQQGESVRTGWQAFMLESCGERNSGIKLTDRSSVLFQIILNSRKCNLKPFWNVKVFLKSKEICSESFGCIKYI